ncbi:MAG: hypothetical protein HUJ26_08135 [Planctomycetaceae bacterium]|nr:hypothetical protein [Planctomycetaceae bacterium]
MTDTMTEAVQQLTERITDWRSPTIEVDAASRWIRNIALAGRDSRNGYQYSQEALTDAVQLYEHKPVFLDHAERLTKPFERSTRDLVGSIVNARFEGDRIRGDIRVLDTEAGRTFLALAEAEQTPVGMSHVVLARRSNDRRQVESIEEVVSVDAVMYPATTQTFQEATQQIDEELKSLQQERDELLEQLQQTKQDLATLQEQQSRTGERLQWLVESGLPDFALTEEFREQILKEEDPQRCRAFIEERKQLLRQASARRPSSRSRMSSPNETDDRAIVKAIRGRRGTGIPRSH